MQKSMSDLLESEKKAAEIISAARSRECLPRNVPPHRPTSARLRHRDLHPRRSSTLLSTEPPKHPHAHQPHTLYDAPRSHVFDPSYWNVKTCRQNRAHAGGTEGSGGRDRGAAGRAHGRVRARAGQGREDAVGRLPRVDERHERHAHTSDMRTHCISTYQAAEKHNHTQMRKEQPFGAPRRGTVTRAVRRGNRYAARLVKA